MNEQQRGLIKDRIQNLEYQEGLFNSIVEKYACVQEAYGSMFIESDSNIYYEKVV